MSWSPRFAWRAGRRCWVIKAAVTLSGLMQAGVSRLAHAGAQGPERESWWILESLSGLSRAALIMEQGDYFTHDLQRRFEEAVDRRVQGEPLAHVLNEAGFRQLMLQSDQRALIPRPETEGLVDLVLARQPRGHVLDI